MNMAAKHAFQPLGDLLLSQYENEVSMSADLKTFLDSNDIKDVLREFILDDQCLLAQVGLVNKATNGEELLQPRPIESHHLRPETTQSVVGALAPSSPTESTSGVLQAVSLLGNSDEDRHRFAGKSEDATAEQFPCRPVSTSYQPEKKVPATRKKRTVFTADQVDLLEMAFSTTHYPSSVLRQQLSYFSGVSPGPIQTWFQNRRARYRCKKDQKTPRRHSSRLSTEKPCPFVKTPSASDTSKESKLPLKPACWTSNPTAQSVGDPFPSPSHLLKDGQPQMDSLQHKYNYVYQSSQVNPHLNSSMYNTNSHPAQHHHTKPWYSPLNSQSAQCMIHYQSNQTDRLHQMPSADWPDNNCAAKYQQPKTSQWCFQNHRSSLHPTSHSTQDPTPSEENTNPSQGYSYQYFPLRYPGASQTSIHDWDSISQYSMPSCHQQQVIPLPATIQTSERELLHNDAFPTVRRPPGNQPVMLDVTQGTLALKHYLHPKDLTTYNSKPPHKTINEYSSSGERSYSENLQEYMYPDVDPFNIEAIPQRKYHQPNNSVPTTRSLFSSPTSLTKVPTSRQVPPAASPAMTECSFASNSLYIDLDADY